MKNLNVILILLLVSFGFSNCTKIGRNITVKGKVLNPITNEAYKGIDVRLLKSKDTDYYGGYKMIKSTISDENGAFELNAGRLGPIWLSTNIEEYKEY